jgi:RHS repeat-associated protein
MTYGARGNLLTLQDSTFDATGSGTVVSTTRYHYAPGTPDSPDSIIDPSGVVTRYEYNTLGLLSRAFSPNDHVTSFIYQLEGALAGLLQSVTDSAVQVVIDTSNWNQTTAHLTTQFTYNALGNDSLLVSPSGNTTIQARDAYQRVQYQTDPAGHRVGYSYSPMNWPTVVTEHLEDQGGGDSLQVARYFYNADGAVDSLLTPVDSSGTRRDLPRRWVYDYANRQIAMIDDYGAVDSVFLDRAGQPDSVRTRRNWKIRYRYDATGRVGSVWWPSTGWALGDSTSFIYDQAGRLLTGLSRAGTLRRSYWRNGLLKTDSLIRSGGYALPQWYRYDMSGRRAWYFNGLDTVTYVYGAVTGELSSVQVNWQGAIPSDSVVFGWDALGRRRSVRFTNGTQVTYAYDRAGILRLVCSAHPGGGSNDALDFRVGVLSTDRDGQPTRREHERTDECEGGFGSNYLSNDSSAYDARHRLVHQALRRPTPPEHDYWYTYDVSGNMTWRVDSIGPVSDRYLVWPGHNRVYGWSLQGAFQLYIGNDSSGNRWSETPFNGTPPERLRYFYYDASERLTGSAYFAGATWYDDRNKCLFDALGRRVNDCDPGLTEWITYDGDNVARTLGGWRYVHGPGLDDPLLGLFQQGVDPHKYYFVTDGAGRALVVADTGGVEQSSSMASSAGAITDAHTFQAQRAPAAGSIVSGLSFFRNRYYDQRTARWTQEDPIGPAGGINLYAYVGNNPATFTDPFGLKADTLEGVLVDQYSREIPSKGSRVLCVDQNVAGDVQAIFNTAVAEGIPVAFNNAYRDVVVSGTGGRPSAGATSGHLAGFAFDINTLGLTPAQEARFTVIASGSGFSSVTGDRGHYQVTGGAGRAYGTFQAAVAEARRSYRARECVDANVEAGRNP